MLSRISDNVRKVTPNRPVSPRGTKSTRKRQKDLLDIVRLIESYPELQMELPCEIRSQVEATLR